MKIINKIFNMKRKKLQFLIALFMQMVVVCKAQTFTYDDGFTYKVTSSSEPYTVTLTKGVEANPIIVPDYVTYNNVQYAVTAIADNAWKDNCRTAEKIVIGNNVETIGGKAFEQCVKCKTLIFGTGIKNIDGKGFEHFGEAGSSCTVIIPTTVAPSIVNKSFEHVKNTTFYVLNEDLYKNGYKTNSIWETYDGDGTSKKGNKFAYPIPYIQKFVSGKWQTVVLPEKFTADNIISVFGKGTKVCYLNSSKYNSENNEYVFNFITTTVIEANTPYLIKLGNKDASYCSEVAGNPNATTLTKEVSITDAKTSDYQAIMTGVYSPYTLKKGEIFLQNDKFYIAEDDQSCYVNANKCYFDIMNGTEIVQKAKFSSLFDDDVTVITNIEDTRNNVDKVYTIIGQKIGKLGNYNSLQRGIYIINGKKVLIK